MHCRHGVIFKRAKCGLGRKTQERTVTLPKRPGAWGLPEREGFAGPRHKNCEAAASGRQEGLPGARGLPSAKGNSLAGMAGLPWREGPAGGGVSPEYTAWD